MFSQGLDPVRPQLRQSQCFPDVIDVLVFLDLSQPGSVLNLVLYSCMQ
jgi:hypothetical protein